MRRLPWFVLVVMLVGACGGSSSPRAVEPVPSASPSPSPTPSLTPEQAVLAAVRAYYEEANRATQTGDVTRLEALSFPQCDCRKLARSIASTFAAGKRFQGARDTVTSTRVTSFTPPTANVAITVDVAAYTLALPDGKTQAFAREQFKAQVTLVQKEERWLFAAVRIDG